MQDYNWKLLEFSTFQVFICDIENGWNYQQQMLLFIIHFMVETNVLLNFLQVYLYRGCCSLIRSILLMTLNAKCIGGSCQAIDDITSQIQTFIMNTNTTTTEKKMKRITKICQAKPLFHPHPSLRCIIHTIPPKWYMCMCILSIYFIFSQLLLIFFLVYVRCVCHLF